MTKSNEVTLWGKVYSVEETKFLALGGEAPLGGGNSYKGGEFLAGSIPQEIGDLTNLTGLELPRNQLTGSIPQEIGNLKKLEYLFLNDNQLIGNIPSEVCNLFIWWGRTSEFNISNNQLCPPYPSCIEDYVGEQDITNCD